MVKHTQSPILGQSARAATLFTRNRHLLIMTLVMILVAGLASLVNLPRIEDPRITTRNATVITPLPGASATRVEALVTRKLEEELRELSEIKTIESTSRADISVIGIELQDWVGPGDNERIFSKVRDRLAAAEARLPATAGKPELDDKRGAVAYSLILSLSWDRNDTPDLGMLNRLAEDLGDRLRNLPGTEQVVLFGAPDEEIRVTVDPAELAALGMSAGDLAARLSAADVKAPAGKVRGVNRDLSIEVAGELDSVARVAQVPLTDDGQGGLLTLGDIARVRKAWQDPPEQIAIDDGRPSVLVSVRTAEALRLDRWAELARRLVADYRAGLDDAVTLSVIFDQSTYTEQRLSSLSGNLLAGAAVVVLVVLLSMGWRPALIVGSALPLSVALNLFGLSLFGEQIHQMTVFGMIIAIGLLIDNSIVMTDAVLERKRAGDDAVQAVAGAVRHLRTPLFASTFTTILGFMPVFLLPGNVGDFVSPIAVSVVLALIASFALAMTVIPALAALLVRPNGMRDRRWWRDGVGMGGFAQGYRGLLLGALRRPGLSLSLSMALPMTGFVLMGSLDVQFFPPADRDQIEVQLWMPSGTGVHRTAEEVRGIERAIREHADVERLTWVVGASSPPVYYNQLRDQDNNPGYARGVVKLTGVADAKRLERELQQELADRFPAAQVVVRAFGQGPPVAAPVGFRIVGPDLDRLSEYGDRLRALMHRQPEVTHTRASILGGVPTLRLAADESKTRLAGLGLSEIATQFRNALNGVVGGLVLEDLEELPVRIRYGDAERGSQSSVGTLRLQSPGTEDWIPAEALGGLELWPELAAISRRNGERVNEIQGFLRQGVLPITVTQALMRRLTEKGLDLAPGYRLEVAGDSAEQGKAVGQLTTYVPLLVVLMIATLVLTFRSFALAGIIGLVAVSSVGLGMLSLWAGGYPLGFNPLIGSAGLVGVAINGSIVVLAAIRADPTARTGDHDAIADATLGATRHIVSTTLTTVAGFMPLLLLSGGGFWPPLAIVIAGGVGFSITLSLVFTPVAYRLIAGRPAEIRVNPEILVVPDRNAGAFARRLALLKPDNP